MSFVDEVQMFFYYELEYTLKIYKSNIIDLKSIYIRNVFVFQRFDRIKKQLQLHQSL